MISKPFTISTYSKGFFVGPDLHLGPMPAVFYFALSAKESLETDPYNQMVVALSSFPVRIFSIDLPGHEGVYSPQDAIKSWASDIERGHDFVTHFVDKVIKIIEELLRQEVIAPRKIGVAGLSRGGFMACDIAAKMAEVSSVLGYAPVTELTSVRAFLHMQENALAQSLNLSHLLENLLHCSLRFYIGNRDSMVDTRKCFDFIADLSESFFRSKHRSPPVELMIRPSIGSHGHGTSKAVFEKGAHWMAKQLGVNSYG